MIRFKSYFLAGVCLCIFTVVPLLVHAASYNISMLPRYSTGEINKRISALAKYLSDNTGLKISVVLTSTFDQYSKKLKSGAIDIGYQNPYIYVLAAEHHEVIAMAEKGRDGDKFRGIIITGPDSPLNRVEDLKHSRISIVSYTSAGGYLSQKLTLLRHNIDIKKDCVVEEAPQNKQENVAFAVYTGDVDAGFIRESALSQIKELIPPGAINVMTSTAWLPNWALSLNRQMPTEDKEKIINAIEQLKAGSPVLKTLKIKGFRAATDSEYNPVREAAGIEINADGGTTSSGNINNS